MSWEPIGTLEFVIRGGKEQRAGEDDCYVVRSVNRNGLERIWVMGDDTGRWVFPKTEAETLARAMACRSLTINVLELRYL